MNLNTLINSQKEEFNRFYNNLLKSHLFNDRLSKAMIYGSMNGGKRIRPFLVETFSKIAKIKKNNFMRLSSAVESIHSYSLIHDDLPSMDNDDYRRGKLSNHKKFDEATAILAGDALHDLAFEIIANEKTHKDPKLRILLISRLSIVIGFKGLAGGQSLDLLFEKKKNIKVKDILKMYKMKTSTLFSFSCVAPFILGKKNKEEIKFAQDFGSLFGLIFQINDDLVDEEKDFNYLGKTPGKDRIQGKSTLISIVNKKELRDYCFKKIKRFEKNNDFWFGKYKILKELLYYNINGIEL